MIKMCPIFYAHTVSAIIPMESLIEKQIHRSRWMVRNSGFCLNNFDETKTLSVRNAYGVWGYSSSRIEQLIVSILYTAQHHNELAPIIYFQSTHNCTGLHIRRFEMDIE